jgi:hypothetical protein
VGEVSGIVSGCALAGTVVAEQGICEPEAR